MKRSVHASAVNGIVAAPASKSVAQRAVIAALLARGVTTLNHLTPCDDTLAAIDVARALGATIEVDGDQCRVTSHFPPPPAGARLLSCGESGLLSRVVTPVASLLPDITRVEGCGTLLARPFDMLVAPLQALGARVTTTNGRLPITLSGPLSGGVATIDGSVSSQLLTGLLLALPLAGKDSTLHVNNLKSKPYIDLTIELLRAFGIVVEHQEYKLFRIPGKQAYRPATYNIEGDWSGASCMIVAGCIAGNVTVTNLHEHSTQADKAILEVARRAGANVTVNGDNSVTASPGALALAFDFDAGESPDLFPAIVALAACCRGVSRIAGAGRLVHKESNRALVLQQEYAKLGIDVRIDGDVMSVTGGEIRGGLVSSRDDHRIAMSLATAALRASAPVTIDGAESVSKSYPHFWEELARLQDACR
ncbi:MAG: 3-phosphoshikimate 1-carboxyvinyltransferase [Odoribacteraceae bacterium]|jgi:3-phosphoshikimate 1-carboxyvinyltransferase|nr:3-phosphoshikimate 1-carboxyvinyltransferase [Odoribacteraceae bacterium]